MARMRSWGGFAGSSARVADTRTRSATAFSDALWPIASCTRLYTAADRALAEEIARRCAAFIETAKDALSEFSTDPGPA